MSGESSGLRTDAALSWPRRARLRSDGYLLAVPSGTGQVPFWRMCARPAGEIPANPRVWWVGSTTFPLVMYSADRKAISSAYCPSCARIGPGDGDSTKPTPVRRPRTEGDSGDVEPRVRMIASQMGDTAYRGRILWMLLTARPDYYPDRHQATGRAEVHIPLFYQRATTSCARCSRCWRRSSVPVAAPEDAGDPSTRLLSGADIEGIRWASMAEISPRRRENGDGGRARRRR